MAPESEHHSTATKKSLLHNTAKIGRKGRALITSTVLPGARRVSSPVASEIKKIHRRQNLLTRFRVTLLHKGLGLYLAMVSANLVGEFIEPRTINNLWGLASQRQLVSSSTYSIVSFIVEFTIALIVFTLTEHYLAEFNSWRKQFMRNSRKIVRNTHP